jgi:hypothetical protein
MVDGGRELMVGYEGKIERGMGEWTAYENMGT